MKTADEDLLNRFNYHPAQGNQPDLYGEMRAHFLFLARHVVGTCPESREVSLALTHLETAMFWANASIARHSELLGG